MRPPIKGKNYSKLFLYRIQNCAKLVAGTGFLIILASIALAEDDEGARIEETYNAWVRTTNARDIDGWASYLAPNAYFVPSDSPSLTTEEEILNYYRRSFADPEFSLDCQQSDVELAESGDMAWARGTCKVTFTVSDNEVGSAKSRWLKVWEKQPNGLWKCRVNTWNVEGPAD